VPWHIERREGRYCVIQDDNGRVMGCHDARTDAVKQSRALYANESRVAAMYAELDAQPEDYGWMAPQGEPKIEDSLSPFAAQLVGLILKDEREKSLTASLATTMDAISQRMASEKEERGALVAALSTIGQPVINVDVAPADVKVDVPTPQVTVEAAQVNVPAPEVKVQVDVPAPNVTVRPEITMPSQTKTITFERDYDGRLSKAEVIEGGVQPSRITSHSRSQRTRLHPAARWPRRMSFQTAHTPVSRSSRSQRTVTERSFRPPLRMACWWRSRTSRQAETRAPRIRLRRSVSLRRSTLALGRSQGR
jgi:hypothetical protein